MNTETDQGETMTEPIVPTETEEEAPPTFNLAIAAIADGKRIDVDDALILFMADGTLRWSPKDRTDND